MMDFISIPLVVGIITLGIYKLFELLVRKKERLSIIDKIGDKLSPANIDTKFSFPVTFEGKSGFGTLKVACLLLGVGLGLLVGHFICVFSVNGYAISEWSYNTSETAGVVFGSTVLVFGGLGLLTAFLVELNHSKKKDEE